MARRKTTIEFLTQVYDLVGDEYSVQEPYQSATIKIKIMHNKCGNPLYIKPTKFLGGSRCSKCSGGGRRKKTTEEIKEELYDLVGDEFTLVGEYVNSTVNVTLKHEVCGEDFPTRFNNFKTRMNCTRCNNSRDSLGERNIRKFLEDNNITYVREKEFEGMVNEGNLRVDFYLPDYNLAIEFNGQQHYKHIPYFGTKAKHERQLENDRIKEKYLQDNKILLLKIPYNELGNEGTIIQEHIEEIEAMNKQPQQDEKRVPEIEFIHSTGEVRLKNLTTEHRKTLSMTPDLLELRERELMLKLELLEIQKQRQQMT